MEYTRRHKGTCSRASRVVIEDGVIKEAQIIGGCDGNISGICKLVVGLPVELVLERFKGTTCGFRPTSCPDQLAITIEEALTQAGH